MAAQTARRNASAVRSPAKQLPLASESTGEQIRTTHTPELVIALCGPIGSPLHEVANAIQSLLNGQYAYDCRIIRASDFIAQRYPAKPGLTKYQQANHLIDSGNSMRQRYGSSVLAELAICDISVERQRPQAPPRGKSKNEKERFVPRRICHIIDSIKNGAELDTLRLVYGQVLHSIGVFASETYREKQLLQKNIDKHEVQLLIDRDAQEDVAYGQSVRSTFPHCDYFIRAEGGEAKLDGQLKRLFELVFGIGVHTPTAGETAMYQAASAARSSACLSRQVGAAILDKYGQLISVGWNDVPEAGGGVYTSDCTSDHRCANQNTPKCHNDHHKAHIAEEVATALAEEGLLERSEIQKASEVVLKSRVGSIIEFSRAVHAEMHALILGSQVAGLRMRGASLYCTTYPCHSCARHIVLAGITSVFYIEPYPKSQAIALHGDAIAESGNDNNLVQFVPYEGVGPNRYLDIFAMGSSKRKTKKDGTLVRHEKATAVPKGNLSLESFPTLEGLVVTRLQTAGVISQNAHSDEHPA